MPKPDRRAMSDFLSMLWPENPPDDIVVWTKTNKQSHWLAVDEIPKLATRMCRTADVYFSVCSHDWGQASAEAKRRGKEVCQSKRRGSGKSASAMPCLWADVDCDDGEHARDNLPTKDEALTLLRSLDQPPSVIVDSGGGFHVYWLLNSVVHLDDDSRSTVKRRIKAFEFAFGRNFLERNWHLDSVAELSRVLRLPGTLNHKYADPRPVTIVEAHPDRRYSFGELAPPVQNKRGRTRRRATESTGSSADAAHIARHCAWFRHTHDDAEELPEPEWFAMLSVLAHCKDGQALAHEWSSPHPDYSSNDTDEKFDYARDSAGPRTCANIRDDLGGKQHCERCPHWGRITSPIELGDPDHPSITWPAIEEEVERIQDSDPDGAFEPDFLRRVVRLKNAAPERYAIVRRRLKGTVDLRDFGRAMKKQARKRTTQRRERDGLPQIQVNDRPYREVVDETATALLAANDPPSVFTRRGLVVRVANGPPPHIEHVTPDVLFARLFRCADFFRVTVGGISHGKPDKDLARALLSDPPGLPELEALALTPVLDRDANLINSLGYHEEACILMPEGALVVEDLPDAPTAFDVDEAKRLILDELLGEFPFDGDSDRAHTMGAMLHPFVRHAIDAPAPLHMIVAPTPGSGKTLLAAAIAIPALGRPVSAQPISDHDDEVRKMLTAAFLSDSPILLLDNASQKKMVDNAHLAGALTAPDWCDRILGRSQMVSVKNRVLWLLTGNNIKLSVELARRSVMTRLDPQRDQPWLREGFRHPNLVGWAMQNRRALVRSLLVLIQNWRAQGAPRSDATLGSFESWAGVVGGILEVNRIPGFLENLRDLYEEADQEGDAYRSFVVTWRETYGSDVATVAQLYEMCETYNLFMESLGDGNERSKRTRLGILLSSLRGRVFGESRILCSKHRGQPQYRLEGPDGPNSSNKSNEHGGVRRTRMRSQRNRSRRKRWGQDGCGRPC